MEQLSFFEKLGVLFNNMLAHPFFICILLLPAVLIFLNKKVKKKAVVLIYIVMLVVILFIGNSTIFALFDNLVDGIFMTLYFPNFITLFLVEVLSAIICFITFTKRNIKKISKIINIVGFSIIQTLFALILTIIQANEIDIYKENALYANNDVLTLMQLLMGAFALQIVTLVVVKAIDKVTSKLDNPQGSEIIQKHTMKLPEGRITHAKLSDKVIIRQQKVITPEPEIVYKEPEVKLDPVKPVLPLNKKLIDNSKISPIDINEEIIKDKNKIKPIIRKETSEILTFDKKNSSNKVLPLDKSLIESTKISPIDINEEIIKDENKPKPTIRKETDEVLSFDKPIDKKVVAIEEKLPLSKLDNVSKKRTNYISKLRDKFEEFKRKSNEIGNNNPLDLQKVESDKILVNDVKEDKNSKFVSESTIKEETQAKPDLFKVMEEPKINDEQETSVFDQFKTIEQKVSEGSNDISDKELITNLRIVNFDKMVKAIKNLSTVYTL